VTSTTIGVVGAGAWGTALAKLLADKGHAVRLWSYEAEVATAINVGEPNPYLPGVALPPELRATSDLGEAVEGAEVVVSVSPAQMVASVMGALRGHELGEAIVVSASKGIERGSLRRMEEVLHEALGADALRYFTALSGPSFAREVAQAQPTAVVAASRDQETRLRVQELFQTPWFRVYTNADVVGVELGGALKNVIALAAGITAGLGYAHNTTAALITRGLAEMTRLGVAMGARKATFYGLAGMGDLVLTCTGALSRNRTVGVRLGRGESLDDIVRQMSGVAEGIKTVTAAHDLAVRYDVEMPIAEQIYAIVERGRVPQEALEALMLRDPKPEEWS